MNINLKLSGVVENIIEEMISKGYASNKTEAIRIALLNYKQHHMQ
jgi:Arc/MetJ-type ribon-helix-helix transcriptional regulator